MQSGGADPGLTPAVGEGRGEERVLCDARTGFRVTHVSLHILLTTPVWRGVVLQAWSVVQQRALWTMARAATQGGGRGEPQRAPLGATPTASVPADGRARRAAPQPLRPPRQGAAAGVLARGLPCRTPAAPAHSNYRRRRARVAPGSNRSICRAKDVAPRETQTSSPVVRWGLRAGVPCQRVECGQGAAWNLRQRRSCSPPSSLGWHLAADRQGHCSLSAVEAVVPGTTAGWKRLPAPRRAPDHRAPDRRLP